MKLKTVDQLTSTEFMAACKDDVFKFRLIACEPLRLVRRGQHFRVSLEIANETPAEKSKQLLTLNRFRREHWALDASN
jgi:hypothetical protein